MNPPVDFGEFSKVQRPTKHRSDSHDSQQSPTKRKRIPKNPPVIFHQRTFLVFHLRSRMLPIFARVCLKNVWLLKASCRHIIYTRHWIIELKQSGPPKSCGPKKVHRIAAPVHMFHHVSIYYLRLIMFSMPTLIGTAYNSCHPPKTNVGTRSLRWIFWKSMPSKVTKVCHCALPCHQRYDISHFPNLADAGRESKAVEAWEAGLANQKDSSRLWGLEGSHHKKTTRIPLEKVRPYSYDDTYIYIYVN